jgi:hypothetical protein
MSFITFDLIDDGVYSVDGKTFTITLSNLYNCELSDTSFTITVVNTDPLSAVNITSAYTFNESDGTVNLTLTRSAGPDCSVNYSTVDGTALSGLNYQSKTGSVVFGSGEMEKNITVTLKDDSMYAPALNFTVVLSNPVSCLLGVVNVSAVTVENVQPMPNITLSPSTVNAYAGMGVVTYTVTLSGRSYYQSVVDYNTSDGSAVSGVDFVNVSGSVVIPPASLSSTFTVTLIDRVTNLTRNFTVSLSNPSNVTMGSNQSNVTLYPWGNPWAPVSNVMSSPTLLLLIAMMVGAVGFMLLSMLLHDNHNAGHIVFGLVSTALSTIVAFMLYSGFVKYVSGDVTTSVENPVLAVVFGAVALVTFGYTAWQVLQTYNYHLKFWGGDKL